MKRIRMLVALAATLLTLLTAVPASIASGLNNFYIIPDSDSRLLTEDELWDWQYEALGYIYNEIFARHGRPFESGGKYDQYFRSQAWYRVNPDYRYGMLDSIERHNEQLAHQVMEDMRAQGTLNPFGKALPSSGTQTTTVLDFRACDFTPGQILEVYTGPGTGYYRSSNGKASVSTEESIWVAGRENGWLAISYETNNGSRRIGYINLSRLKDNLSVQSLSLFYSSALIQRGCSMTDEPDGSCAEIVWLGQNTKVTLLGPYVSRSGESWAYIEVSGSQPIRGFVPANCISTGTY